jgi:hypothetical protein
MIKQSYDEYVVFGETYLQAIEYFIEAYEAGDFLAESAYRQLNFYNGLDEREEERLGDAFSEGVDEFELATMFLEGNTYAIKNIRALIGMGVSYNEDGLTYLEKVTEAAGEMDADASVFEGEDYEDLAETISNSFLNFREMLRELSAVEKELNFEDEEFTELELQYAEHQALAEMFRKTTYLGGETLYAYHFIGFSFILIRMIGVSVIAIRKDRKKAAEQAEKTE